LRVIEVDSRLWNFQESIPEPPGVLVRRILVLLSHVRPVSEPEKDRQTRLILGPDWKVFVLDYLSHKFSTSLPVCSLLFRCEAGADAELNIFERAVNAEDFKTT